MQRPDQLTADAAFKFALWRQLWSSRLASASPDGGTAAVNQAMAVHVQRVAFPAVQRALPRRIVQPCCMSGTCVPRGPLYTHAALHPGRAEIVLTHPIAVRDESCWCAAHFAASSVPQPAVLQVRRYRATEVDTRQPHQGLRCLLKHVQLQRIEFTDVLRWQDAQAVVAELASLLLRQGYPTPSGGVAPAWREGEASGRCASIKLCRVPTPGHAMSRFLRLAAAVDSLAELCLDGCGMGDLHALAAYARSSRTLKRLDLTNSDHLAVTDWAELGEAVGHSASVTCVGLSGCGWGPVHLDTFLASLNNFQPREGGLALDLSRQRSLSVEYCLSAMVCLAPAALVSQLSGLCVSELETPPVANAALGHLSAAHPEVSAGAGVALFFARFTQLCQLSLAGGSAEPSACVMEPSLCQRVMRGVGDRGGTTPWKSLDLSGQPIAQASLKRLLQAANFTAGASLQLRGVHVGDIMGKLAGLGACLRQLHSLDLSGCLLGDSGLTQLSTALERAAPLSLQTLKLDNNPFEKAFPFLCKSLRAHCLPELRELHLSSTKLPVRPVLTLLEQITCLLQSLVTHATTFADSTQDRTLALTTIARRQRGECGERFRTLDWWCAPSPGSDVADEPDTSSRELQEWLHRQTNVRLLRRTE